MKQQGEASDNKSWQMHKLFFTDKEMPPEQGHANAQYKLGRIYEDGMGVVQNYKEAAKWYKKAAGQGMKRAQARHAGLYYFGDVGFAKDKVYATRVLKQMSISIQSDAR